jgi:DNA-binding cell septation regulator SpoVG
MRKKTKNVIKRCSFCGKLQDQVLRILEGPKGLFICNECVNLCREMLREGSEKPNVLSGDVPFSLVPITDVKHQKVSSQREKDARQCSFCGKSQDHGLRLLAGPEGLFICSETVNLCCEILEFEEEEIARKHREDEKRPVVESEEKGNIVQKWEYLVATLDNLHPQGDDEIEERMCTWGKDGWELVSATAFSHVNGTIGMQCHAAAAAVGNTSTKIYVKLFFKRLKR